MIKYISRLFNVYIVCVGGSIMKEDYASILLEIREMLKMVSERQDKLLEEINRLKEEQKKLAEEVKISNFVLNNITVRNEIVN